MNSVIKGDFKKDGYHSKMNEKEVVLAVEKIVKREETEVKNVADREWLISFEKGIPASISNTHHLLEGNPSAKKGSHYEVI